MQGDMENVMMVDAVSWWCVQRRNDVEDEPGKVLAIFRWKGDAEDWRSSRESAADLSQPLPFWFTPERDVDG